MAFVAQSTVLWHPPNTRFDVAPDAFVLFVAPRGVTRLEGAWGKNQICCPHVRTWGLSEANVLHWRKYLWHCWDFSAPPAVIRHPGNCAPLLAPVCLSANCTNNSAILNTLDSTTLFDKAICLTPVKRWKLSVDRAEIKQCFSSQPVQILIKAFHPRNCLSRDLKGPVRGACPYLLVAVDECKRFPFVFPCKKTKSSAVIACLCEIRATPFAIQWSLRNGTPHNPLRVYRMAEIAQHLLPIWLRTLLSRRKRRPTQHWLHPPRKPTMTSRCGGGRSCWRRTG